MREFEGVAKEEHTNVFVDFYTDWCAPCKRMSMFVFPEKKLGDYMNSRYVCLQLNAEKEGKALTTIVEWLKANGQGQDEATVSFSNKFIEAANKALKK